MRDIIADVLGLAGVAAIITGAFLLAVPVGIIVAGAAALAAAWRVAK